MSVVNSLGIAVGGSSGTQGPRGNPGVGVQSITSTDNHDGSISLTFSMTDGTTVGPITNSTVSDDLIALDKITLTGTNNASKFQISDNSGHVVMNVDTTTDLISLPRLTPSQFLALDSSGNIITSSSTVDLSSYLTIASAASTYVSNSSLATSLSSYVTSSSLTSSLSSYLTTSTASTTYLPLAGGTLTGNLQLGGTVNSKFQVKDHTNAAWFTVDPANFVIRLDGLAPNNGILRTINSNGTLVVDPTSYATTSSLSSYATTASLSSYLPLTGGTVSGGIILSGTGNGNKLVVTDPASNTAFGVDTTATTVPGFNVITMDQAVVNITALNTGQLVQNSTSGYLTTSNTLPVSCSATSMTLTNPNIGALANLTTNGFVKTSGSNGTLSVDTTSYATTASLSSYVTSSSLTTTLSSYATTASLSSYVTSSSLTTTLSSYLTTASASSTYQTTSGMSSYLTTASASSTYLPLTGGALTGPLTIGSSYQSSAGPYLNLATTDTVSTDCFISLTNNSNTAALTTGMISMTNTTAFGNIFINMVSGTATTSTSTIQMSCGNGSASQTGTITCTGSTPIFSFNRTIACTSLSAGTGTITGTGNWTVTNGLLTSTASPTAGTNSNRLTLANTTNSATAGTTVGITWTATNAAGSAQQSGLELYGATGWLLQPPAATGILPVLTLSNLQATSGAGTSLTFQGYTSSAQTAYIQYNGTNFQINSAWWNSSQTILGSNWFDGVNTRNFSIGWTGYSSGYAIAFTGTGSFYPLAYTFSTTIVPATDNVSSCGTASYRWLNTYSTNLYTSSWYDPSGTYSIKFVGGIGFQSNASITPLTDTAATLGSASYRWANIYSTGLTITGNSITQTIYPNTDNSFTLGTGGARWTTIYATTGTINTSDSREKNSITPVTTAMGLAFINQLNPVSYKWDTRENQVNSDGSVTALPGVRTHYGMISQDIQATLTANSMTTDDFAGFVYDSVNDKYGLRYEEFISPMIKAIQEIAAQVTSIQNELNTLVNGQGS